MIRERFGTEHVVFESYVLVYPTRHNRRKIGNYSRSSESFNLGLTF